MCDSKYYLREDGVLMHYAIPGQKRGVRRWTNPDGTLNEAGKLRYAQEGPYLNDNPTRIHNRFDQTNDQTNKAPSYFINNRAHSPNGTMVDPQERMKQRKIRMQNAQNYSEPKSELFKNKLKTSNYLSKQSTVGMPSNVNELQRKANQNEMQRYLKKQSKAGMPSYLQHQTNYRDEDDESFINDMRAKKPSVLPYAMVSDPRSSTYKPNKERAKNNLKMSKTALNMSREAKEINPELYNNYEMYRGTMNSPTGLAMKLKKKKR